MLLFEILFLSVSAFACPAIPQIISFSDTTYDSAAEISMTNSCQGNQIEIRGQFADAGKKIRLMRNTKGELCYQDDSRKRCATGLTGEDKIIKDGKTVGIVRFQNNTLYIFSADPDGRQSISQPNIQIWFKDNDQIEVRAHEKADVLGLVHATRETVCTRSVGLGSGRLELKGHEYKGGANCDKGGFVQTAYKRNSLRNQTATAEPAQGIR